MQLPVIGLSLDKQELWPIVAIIQKPYLVCCIPLLETSKEENKDNFLKIPSISVGFSVLLGILNILQLSAKEEKQSQLWKLENFLTLNMPFGTPSDVESSSLTYLNSFQSSNFLTRQPAWKPFDHRGKQRLHLTISEFVRCMQTDDKKSQCHCKIFGQVSVKAELEGINEVSLGVSSLDNSQPLILDSVLVHPCVQILSGLTSSASGMLKRLHFTPPLHEFILLHYALPDTKNAPISGVFKMLGDATIELMVQLKLNDAIKNVFEYFDAVIVFLNRGPVKSINFNVNHGVPKLSEDKYSLKWSIGTKFPKELEVALTAKIEFQEEPIMPHSDPFCIDKNCYVQINFRQSNSTLSGCNIDPKTVNIKNSKAKVIIDRSIQSAEYRIWNNYGDVPFPVNIEKKYANLFS
ncbi:AP-5 complex subunit mu-1-like isoform X2 [Uloborus diversus]|nr:AP-5 complex subunit mu-1-like isoform X2 [Uloborus diversus]